jgi:predicted SAM-dependent methyltransferase
MSNISVKLNLGCGKQFVDGWVNVDYALGARICKMPLIGHFAKKLKIFNANWNPAIYLHNLVTPFPWADGSVDIVYSSHTVEHMTRAQGQQFLSECVRVLKPGGILRIVVPDLRAIVDRYVAGNLKSEFFLDDLFVLYESFDNKIKNKLAPFVQFPHKCMYDADGMIRACAAAGINVDKSEALVSSICDISDIEIPNRTVDAVIVEGVKR